MNNAVVIARIDLNSYCLDDVKRLVMMGVVMLADVAEMREFKLMTEWNQVLWVRELKSEMKRMEVKAAAA